MQEIILTMIDVPNIADPNKCRVVPNFVLCNITYEGICKVKCPFIKMPYD